MWKEEKQIFLPKTKEEWIERIKYIKSVIREIFIDYNLINFFWSPLSVLLYD